ncbi:MAG: universal stress protein [Candidatus Sericytochromatia bacterium]|nr:universal stress protein [Candidatus Sericytochromatia bacterium]
MRIMIATHGSEACEDIFHQLKLILVTPAALSEVVVVTVIDQGDSAMQALSGILPTDTRGVEDAQQTLDRARQLLGPLADKAYFRQLSGTPGVEIVRFAREVGAQLLVVGSRTRHGLDRLVMGSVSAHVVANAPCSVQVVK